MGMTFFIAFLAFLVSWGLAILIGIYVAVKQYSFADYFFTFIGFIGLATPGFLLALVLMYISYAVLVSKCGLLYSPEFEPQPMSWAKFVDLLKHLWLPVLILNIAGMANIIPTLQASCSTICANSMSLWRAPAPFRIPDDYAISCAYCHQSDPQPDFLLMAWLFSRGTALRSCST